MKICPVFIKEEDSLSMKTLRVRPETGFICMYRILLVSY